ncbi:sensor histidine kinase [Winogradskyella psychrotolerans]|uniref:sensor histidine kinase n=1 Tax=Winogradskyella psychrotolerans TaxID=1344585 RepID=UPI001C06D549|nr:HAMP domain-containing sensor histidine kinase [Winogradskyella psychrotolerans]MBU2927558.1 PAS domain S-box protein [Winogradskyella psychrotolerans]
MPKNLKRLKNKVFQNIFENANGGISIVSLDGVWIKVNQSIVNLLGYEEAELYKLNFRDITHRDDIESDLAHMQQLLDGEIDNYQIEKRYFHKKGYVVWTLLSVSLVRDENDEPVYFISQLADISTQKSATWHLEFLMNVIKGQNESLKDFAHIATHDIRTHVGNLCSITEFLEEELKETLTSNENYKMLKDSLGNLDDTINHLNLMRLNKPKKFNILNKLSLYNYIENSIYNVSAIAKRENCEIINKVDKGCYIMGIEAYIDSIILNFLTNSIKYKSDERRATIELSSSSKDEFVVLKVKDNGLGIDLESNYNKLFTLNGTFHEHPDSRGVGLYITKNHIESIGGKIEVESKVNKGTCFSIYFLSALNAVENMV